MFRKSLGICMSLAFAISLRQQGSILLRNPSPPQPLSWTRTLLREAGCRRGGRSRRCHSRGNWAPGGIGGLLFQYPSRVHIPVHRRFLRGQPRRFTAVCDGAEAPPQNAV